MTTKNKSTDAAAADRDPVADKSSLNSAVTTDLPNDAPDTAEQEQAMKDAEENQPAAVQAGLVLVKVDGIDFRYVGVAPARDKNAETPSGYPITVDNSTVTPLDQVPFSNSIRIKDPKSGEYYYPADGVTSWDGCELNGSYLIPRKDAKK